MDTAMRQLSPPIIGRAYDFEPVCGSWFRYTCRPAKFYDVRSEFVFVTE